MKGETAAAEGRAAERLGNKLVLGLGWGSVCGAVECTLEKHWGDKRACSDVGKSWHKLPVQLDFPCSHDEFS